MATIGVGPGSYIRPVNIRRVRSQRYRVDASQTIRAGDPLLLSADTDEGNRVKLYADGATADRGFVGFAAQAITTGASPTYPADEIIVWLADNDAEFLCHVSGTLDNDQISVEYGLVVDSTNNIWRLDLSDTTNKIFRIIRLRDAHGDVSGRVVVNVIAPERLYGD